MKNVATTRRLTRAMGVAILAGTFALMGGTAAVSAQSPTPENTEIVNIATVSYTDANGNTYQPVSGSATVTVGFLPGIDVSGDATAAPVPGSTDNVQAFQVCNTGNGSDTFVVSLSNSDPSVVTNVRYEWNGNTYTTLQDLNAALAASPTLLGACITVNVIYDAGTVSGSSNLELTATSGRDSTVSDPSATTVTTTIEGTISVTPDAEPVSQLPSNGTQYQAEFTLTNDQNITDSFDLLASVSGTADLVIVDILCNGVSCTSVDDLAPGGSTVITVVYTAGDVAAGSTGEVILTATSQLNGAITDAGSYDVTVIRPALTIAKEAYLDDRSATTATALPGGFLQYKITVTNTGTATAEQVHIDDLLPSELTFVSAEGDVPADWTITNSGNDVDADLNGTLAIGASRFIWIRAQVQ